MNNKFSIEELMTRVMPGGVLLATLYFVFLQNLLILPNDRLDFLFTFLFFCFAFIAGELLQVLAHELEFIIDLFFKCRRPSQVFLYENNPVLKDEYSRIEILGKLQLNEKERDIFAKEYKDLPTLIGRVKGDDNLSQSIFWKLYTKVSDKEEIRFSIRNYLFARVIMVDFLVISTVFFVDKSIVIGFISLLIFFLFLWRSRGVARGLVLKTVLLNLKDK